MERTMCDPHIDLGPHSLGTSLYSNNDFGLGLLVEKLLANYRWFVPVPLPLPVGLFPHPYCTDANTL